HGDYVVLRVGGDYRYHAGKAVQDINNSFTMSIQCIAGNSMGGDPNNYVFASNSSTGNTNMYIIECTSLDARGYDNFNNSTMYLYDGTKGNLLTKTNRDQAGSVLEILTEDEVFV